MRAHNDTGRQTVNERRTKVGIRTQISRDSSKQCCSCGQTTLCFGKKPSSEVGRTNSETTTPVVCGFTEALPAPPSVSHALITTLRRITPPVVNHVPRNIQISPPSNPPNESSPIIPPPSHAKDINRGAKRLAVSNLLKSSLHLKKNLNLKSTSDLTVNSAYMPVTDLRKDFQVPHSSLEKQLGCQLFGDLSQVLNTCLYKHSGRFVA